MEKISGIYKITNTITGDFYIGSSKNVMERWAGHKSPSRWICHPNIRLYQDMAQYGPDYFTVEIIEETIDLREREQYWIDKLSPSYNVCRAYCIDSEKRKVSRCRYQQSEKGKAANRKYANSEKGKGTVMKYKKQLCEYNGEILTLHALSNRFYRAGIEHATLEAKKYLI